MFKRWKYKNTEEKCNSLWFLFKILIIVSIIQGVLVIVQNSIVTVVYMLR